MQKHNNEKIVMGEVEVCKNFIWISYAAFHFVLHPNEFLLDIVLLIKVLIALIIWLSWKAIYRKERHRMKENEVAEKERESISKHEKAMKEENAKEQENRMEQERIESERRATEERAKEERDRQERLRKEKERKRAEQKKKTSIAGRGNDIVTDSMRIVETSAKMLYDDTKYIIKMSKELFQKRAEEKKLTEGECNKIVQTYENLKNNVVQLEKVNKNLETLKEKKVIEKYETSKQALEKKICETLDIKKDKPKLLHSKKAVETSFREKIQKGLADLGEKVSIAKDRLGEIRNEKKSQFNYSEDKPETTCRAKTVAPKTRTR